MPSLSQNHAVEKPRWRVGLVPASAPVAAPRLVDDQPNARRRASASVRRPISDDDGALISRILDGDVEAFQRLVEKHHAKVFRLVQGILIDWHHSEDVCQDVFTIVYRKLPGFQSRAQFSTWLYRVAVNAALKARRRWHKYEPKSLDLVRDFADREPNGVDFEGSEVFEKLLRPLPEKLRIAVVLREQGDLSYDEIARVLKCTRGAVEQRLHRAMTQLRQTWKERFECEFADVGGVERARALPW